MNSSFRTSIMSAALLISAVAGCASSKPENMSGDRRRINPDNASFAAGADRTPTAGTSYGLAKILISQGRDRDALYVLSRIVQDHPKFLPAYNEIAGVYVRSDRVDDAIAVLSTALNKAPQDPILLNNIGTCYLLSGDQKQALESFTQAIEASPANPIYRANRAAALGMLGRDTEAAAEYGKVVSATAARQNLAILAQARKQQAPTTAPSNAAADLAAPRSVSTGG